MPRRPPLPEWLAILWGLLAAGLIKATPLIWAATGGLLSERSGVVNLALEGMLLIGAFAWAAALYGGAAPWQATLWTLGAGATMGFVLWLACCLWRGDHIVAGLALNLVAAGATVILAERVSGGSRSFSIPEASRLGEIAGLPALTVAALLALGAVDWIVFKTVAGTRLRACGESPAVAADLGVPVLACRLAALTAGGMLAALGGAFLADFIGLFTRDMSAGRGFLALAALIVGSWTGTGVLGASLLFGAVMTLGERLPTAWAPPQLINALPWLAVLAVLSGLARRPIPPAALGKRE